MAKIIRRLPFVSHQEEHSIPGSKLVLLPNQIIVGPKSLADGKVEIKNRRTGARELISVDDAIVRLGGAA